MLNDSHRPAVRTRRRTCAFDNAVDLGGSRTIAPFAAGASAHICTGTDEDVLSLVVEIGTPIYAIKGRKVELVSPVDIRPSTREIAASTAFFCTGRWRRGRLRFDIAVIASATVCSATQSSCGYKRSNCDLHFSSPAISQRPRWARLVIPKACTSSDHLNPRHEAILLRSLEYVGKYT